MRITSMRGKTAVLKFAAAGMLLGSAAADTPAQGLAGDYLIRRFEKEHGLPENSATAFAQTAEGYLWFGTFDGLVRFDGTECEVFNAANVPEMNDPGIANLYLDARQRMWVSTYDGLLIREGESWRHLGPKEGWTGDYARSFAGRPNGDVLITDFIGRVFESTGGSVRELPAQPGEPGQGCIGGVDEEGHWWVVQKRFTGRLEDGRWVEKVSMPEVSRDAVGCGQARGGGLWILLGQELRRIQHGVENARILLPELAGGFWSLTEDSRGHVWIATHDRGICRVAPDGTLTRWDEASGGADKGRAVFEDREGNLWLGTSGDGLARLSPRRFRHYEVLPGRRGVQVQSVYPRQAGGLWLATYGNGLFRMEAGGAATPEAIPDPEQAMSYLHTALEDRSGRLWLGTLDHGLRFWQNGVVSPLPGTTEAGQSPTVLFEDARGRLWAASDTTVAVRENERWRTLDGEQGLPAGGATSIAEDSTGVIWLAHIAGVYRVGPDEKASPLLAEGAPVGGIFALVVGEAGTMWLGSTTSGLLRWKSGRLVKVPGIPVNLVGGLVADAKGSLWMSSERRLIRVPQGQLHAAADGAGGRLDCEVFDGNDGLPAVEFIRNRQPAAARDAAGRLWFAMTKGVLMADPAMLRRNVLPPPVKVQRLRYHLAGSGTAESGAPVPNADSAEERRGPFPGEVSLPPGSRRLEIHYTALSLTAPEKNRYEIRLDGNDNTWTDAGNQRMAYYHDLAPGHYVFRVRAANNDGVWNEAGASLAFAVQPFYWQTIWFRVLAVTAACGLLSGGVWLGMRSRLRYQQERLLHERELQTAREELAHLTRVDMLGELSGSIAHELNQPLSAMLNNAQAGLRFLRKGTPNLTEMQALLEDIADDAKRGGGIIHGMKAMFKKEARQEPQPLEVKEIAGLVMQLLHSESLARRTELEFDPGPNLPPVLAGKVELTQVLLNLVLNSLDAMKDSPGPRKVRITTAMEDRSVCIRVLDSGPGIAPEIRDRLFQPFVSSKPAGLGLGLAISRTIIDRFGGQLHADNRAEGGAEFRILLPAAGRA